MGKNYEEIEAFIKKELNAKRQEAKKKVPFWIEKGKELIFPERYEDWEKCVNRAVNDGYYLGDDIAISLEIIEALKNGATLEDADKILMEKSNSASSESEIRNIVFGFSDRGPEFYEKSISRWNLILTDKQKENIENKKKENIELLKKYNRKSR